MLLRCISEFGTKATYSNARVKCVQIWRFNLSQEKEYKDALEAYNEKNKEKVQLVGRLMEVSNVS